MAHCGIQFTESLHTRINTLTLNLTTIHRTLPRSQRHLYHRAHKICDSEHLSDEKKRIDETLKLNGYSKRLRNWQPRPKPRTKELATTVKKAFLPYSGNVADKIRRVLRKHKIQTTFRPPPKIKQLLRSPKYSIPLEKPGVYAVPCSTCGKFYIGETKRNIKVRLKEHIKALQKNAVTKSAICEHVAYNSSHEIHFHRAKSLATERFYIPRLVREAIEIKKHENFNRDSSFKLSTSWNPVIKGLKRQSYNDNNNDIVSVVCRESTFLRSDNDAITPTHAYNLRSRSALQQ